EALASVVADRDQVDEAVRESGQDVSTDDGTADRLMMPLPTNAEQERIARQLATSRGVTVQGPPGTGKSHTIVNLVSHLVAQGKRVLVTAEKEQAL
ncbi:AAA domain-containing protein, partial [Halalkalibacter sp. APA_J-10(15)]